MLLKTAQNKMSAYLTGGGARMMEVNGKHVYNGSLPSTSEILRVFSFGEFPNVEAMETAAHIGTAVHSTIASVFSKDEVLIDEMMIDDERYQNCIKAFSAWNWGKNIQPVAIEKAFASPRLGFGGTIDLVAYVDGVLTLMDYKTGICRFKDFIQICLYSFLLKECTGIIVKDLMLLYLNKETGEFKERRCPDINKLRLFVRRVLRFYKATEKFKKLVDGRRKLDI